MKNTFNFSSLCFGTFLSIIFLSFFACSEDLVVPNGELISSDLQISSRTEGPVSTELIKQKVSVRDNIPLVQILTCTYYGQTAQGYWEYRLTTQYNGPKIYTVTKIIGDEVDGC
ncbi:MAG: hypothetical protein ABI851_16615 [Saprospiraceae bacterium]